jgi:hypothetical protein
MMQGKALAAIFVLGLALAGGAVAQTPAKSQPDWPCRQVRVANLSLGGVWTGPSIDAAQKIWRDDPAILDLVVRISARRTPVEEAERLIADFARAAGDKRKERLTTLFAGVYDRLDSERREVVGGLGRFGLRLKDMAEQAREETQALRDRQDKAPADSDKIKELADALQWRLRLFEEQRRMVGFVCESPALIEQRLGALARAILASMN